jgi:hypothetical protein
MIKAIILPLILFTISIALKFNSFIKLTYGIILAISLAIVIISNAMKKSVN